MSSYFHITTFGCQMNEHDSEIIAGLLTEKGMTQTDDIAAASIEIINTCSVRENADKRFFGTLGTLKKRKENDPSFIVCVCGCMMQQQSIVDEIKSKYPWVDVVFGTHNIHEIPSLIDEVRSGQEGIIDVLPDSSEIVEGLPARRLFKHKSLVNIMYGCNNFCTYCIVPYTRGREKSRTPEAVVGEIKMLAEDGVKEVMLLGQNVNSYKGLSETGETSDFPDLIRRINEIDGIERIRFMTSHPKDLSDRLVDAFTECDKLCRNIHLPVQCGSDRILKRMNRHYTREGYLSLIEKLRARVPEITISTDIIVGFPGETEEDFEDTLSLVREVRYDSAFTFLYSKRNGTPAARYEDQIPEDVKHERFNRLVEAVNEISAEKNAAYVGRTEKIIVDEKGKTKGTLAGRTDGFKLVNFKGGEDLIGRDVLVKITGAKTFSLFGEQVR
ncbi:MAG: tRNA (N6-isopentenyl adenosine(37)-C2)-methylthiotransferase MiaB [Eubacterium sp.]|jgi:tRNA-2-methylthio-N6-dimethylallyladenosine synthase